MLSNAGQSGFRLLHFPEPSLLLRLPLYLDKLAEGGLYGAFTSCHRFQRLRRIS